MTARVRDRLGVARRRAVVGRAAEAAELGALLTAADPPALVHLHGPGGVGKTTLLRVLEQRAQESGRAVVWVDLADVEPTAAGVWDGLRRESGASPAHRPAEVVAAGSVVVLDRFERIEVLARWVWERLLPALPADVTVVTAGRRPPPAVWLQDPAWPTLGRSLPVRNLPASDAAALLHARGVPASLDVADLVRVTHGHPLALTIAADRYAELGRRGEELPASLRTLMDHPDAAARLLGGFLDEVAEPVQRQALHVCAHARRVDRGLLRDVLELDEAGADGVLAWLRERPYAETHPDGLALHDVVRDALDRDLRWRDRDAFAALHHRIRAVVVRRMQHSHGADHYRATQDLLFLHRGNPAAEDLYAFDTLGAYTVRGLAHGEEDLFAALFGREGPERAAAAAHWARRRPEACHLAETPTGEPAGALAVVDLAVVDLAAAERGDAAAGSAEDAVGDALVPPLREALARVRPPEPGEVVLHHLVVDAEHPDRLGGFSDVVAAVSLREWARPRLGWVVLSSAYAATWAPLWTYIGFEPLTQVTLPSGAVVDLWARDFSRSGYADWLRSLEATELDDSGTAPRPVASPVALARPAFGEAMRSLLRDFVRPDRVAGNPLADSRLAQDPAGGPDGLEDPVERLRARVRLALASLADSPRLDGAVRAVDRTYLRPAPTQERAAELLGVPFSTYRRHLKAGTAALEEVLWSWELHGVPLATPDGGPPEN